MSELKDWLTKELERKKKQVAYLEADLKELEEEWENGVITNKEKK